MYTLTAADFADTGQWRLNIVIKPNGLQAFLINTIHEELPPQELCSETWERNKETLKKNLEEVVYRKPRLLDDFATKIIMYDICTLFIPTIVSEENPGAEVEIYNSIYLAEPDDIMYDRNEDVTAVWSMAPGVRKFLLRTFPGAVLTCNLMEKVKMQRRTFEGKFLNIDVRQGEIDLVLTENDRLISASTQIGIDDDVDSLSTALIRAYDFDINEVKMKITKEQL